jgi:hypothetical protein
MILRLEKVLCLSALLAVGAFAGCGIGGNMAPTVVAAAVPATIELGDSATLKASAFDANLDPLTFLWTQVAGDAVVIDNPMSANATVTPDALGEFSFQVAVSDGTTVAVSDVVTLTVVEEIEDGGDGEPPAENQPPEITTASLSPADGTPGTHVDMIALADDPDGDPVSFQWTQRSGPAVTIHNPSSALAHFFSPNVDAITDLGFRVTVSDGQGGQVFADLTYTASPEPFLTVWHEPSDSVVFPGQGFFYLITIFNESSTRAATNVHVVASPPTGVLTLISTTGGGVISGSIITWDIPVITPSQTYPPMGYWVGVKDDAAPGLVFSTVTVTADEFLGPVVESAAVQIELVP